MKIKRLRLWALLLCLCLLPLPALGETAEGLLQKAMNYTKAQEYEKAFSCYELAALARPDWAVPLLSKGQLHLRLGDASAALEAADAALSRDPLLSDVWLLRCKAHIALEQGEEAAHDLLYAEVTGAGESDLVAQRFALGRLWTEVMAFAKAVEIYEQLDFAQLTEEARENYTLALLRTGNRNKAVSLGLAVQAVRDKALDAAFEKGALSLVEEDWAAKWMDADLSGYEMGVPASFMEEMGEWEYEILRTSEDGRTVFVTVPLEEMRTFSSYMTPISISPDGKTLLLNSDYALYALRGKTIIALQPVYDRGAGDPYGKFVKQANSRDFFLPGENGVVWSPDGRYAVMGQYYKAMTTAQFLDLVLMDTWTGEIFPVTAYPKSVRDGAGTVVHVRFDEAGRYLYYGLYGGGYEYRNTLMRYDLETQENTLCYNGPGFIAYSGLWQLPDGRLMNLIDATDLSKPVGLNVYTPVGEDWRNDARYFFASQAELKALGEEAQDTPLPRHFISARQLEYCPLSGFALIRAYLANINPQCLIRVDTEMDFAGMSAFWVLDSLQTRAARPLPLEELASLTGDQETLSQLLLEKYAVISAMALSPDGNYALLNAHHRGESAFLLLRLEDMTLQPVSVPEELNTNILGTPMGYAFRPSITWHEDGRLLILGEETIKTYQIKGN